MTDAHVHIEKGPYTKEWIDQFVDRALEMGIDRLYLLEHSHRFVEFKDAYVPVATHDEYQREWLERRQCARIGDYIRLAETIRGADYPLEIKFGLEICYLPGVADVIAGQGLDEAFDFLTGSAHWIRGWGFDHKKHFWEGADVDRVYLDYYELLIGAIGSGLFDIIAHPDSIKCFGFYPSFDQGPHYERIARAAAAAGVALEQSCGLKNNYGHEEIGLAPVFLRTLEEYGVPLATASDAHRPEDVGKNIREAVALLGAKD